MTEQTSEINLRRKTWQEMALRDLKALSDVAAQVSFLIAAERPVDAYFAFGEDSRRKADAIERSLRYLAETDVKARLRGEGQANV